MKSLKTVLRQVLIREINRDDAIKIVGHIIDACDNQKEIDYFSELEDSLMNMSSPDMAGVCPDCKNALCGFDGVGCLKED